MTMTPGERTGLVFLGAVVALGSGGLLYYDYTKTKTATTSGNQVSLKVLGYQTFVSGVGAALTTSSLASYAAPSEGETIAAALQVSSAATSALAVGVRGWIIQGGFNVSGRTLVAPMVTGTVEGHMFPVAQPTASSPETGSLTIPAQSSVTTSFYSAPVIGGIATPGAGISTLGILWAAGPVAAVQALPAYSGTLPTAEGIAYLWQPSAIRATFNLETGVA
jgi:hypothetical protein